MRRAFEILLTILLLAAPALAAAAEADATARLDEDLKALTTFEYGQNADPLKRVEKTVFASVKNPAQREAVEERLLKALESATTRDAKSFLGRPRRPRGPARAAPQLEALLTDPELSHMARYALGRIEAPAAVEALHRALGKTSGQMQTGIIYTLAGRRYRLALPDIARLADARDKAVAQAAREAVARLREGVESTTAPVARPEEGWMKRHANMNARVAQGNVDLLLIGDSITQGWEGGGAKVWEEFYGRRNAVNLGIGGDRTQHVLWRLRNGNLKGIAPKLAVVMIGTNNASENSPEEIAAGVRAIVEELRATLPRAQVLVLGIFPRGPDNSDPRRQVNREANEILARLADGKAVRCMDIGPKFLGGDGTLSKEIMPDLLHLSPQGYTIWAESIEPVVAEVIGPK